MILALWVTAIVLAYTAVGVIAYGCSRHLFGAYEEDAMLLALFWPVVVPVVGFVGAAVRVWAGLSPVRKGLSWLGDWPLYLKRRRERKALPEVPKCTAREVQLGGPNNDT